jgi:CDP-6-deoxy-D-xylo-4-hexulose-3-dehydrase
MGEKQIAIKELKKLIRGYFRKRKEDFIPGKTKIPLNVPSFGWQEVSEALESMLTTNVTMGKKVQLFEKMFAEYIGVDYAVMVNSGSSANLIGLSLLSTPRFSNQTNLNGEIITPAVTWATTVSPIIMTNNIPVIVDVNLDTYNIDIMKMKGAISRKTKAIMPVHLLGNPCDIKTIVEIANDNDLFVIEDTCESYGAEFGGKKVGSFGDLATVSFFFSHHITTIEGGMLLTNNEKYSELAKSLRAHGWIRELTHKNVIIKEYKNIDEKYLFYNIGYNLRPSEIQGAFGIHQIKKLNRFIEIRRRNAKYWTKKFKKYSEFLIVPHEKTGTKHVWFGYPLTVRKSAPFTKKDLVNFLTKNKIETRPIMAGDITQQPFLKERLFKYKISGDLKNSKIVMDNSFFFGNHQGIGKDGRNFIADSICDFVENKID